MFIRMTNGIAENYTLGQLRCDNPNVSFPKDIPVETLASYSVYVVKRTPAPQVDSLTHRHNQSVEFVDREWTQAWSAVELPLDQAQENVRAHRNRLLQDTDWIVAASYERNGNVPQDWQDYRQALRDITDQEGFPYSVIWPTKPE